VTPLQAAGVLVLLLAVLLLVLLLLGYRDQRADAETPCLRDAALTVTTCGRRRACAACRTRFWTWRRLQEAWRRGRGR
jgi:hypothetical protein